MFVGTGVGMMCKNSRPLTKSRVNPVQLTGSSANLVKGIENRRVQ